MVYLVVSKGLPEKRKRSQDGAFPAAIRPVKEIDLSEVEISGGDEAPEIVESQAGDHLIAIGN